MYVRGITGSGEDSTLSTLVSRADAVFASYLGLPPASAGAAASLEDQTITLYMDGPGGQELRLPYAPVLSITSIHDSDDRLYSSADLVAASDYELYGSESLIRLTDTSSHGFWSTTRRAVAQLPAPPENMTRWLCIAGYLTGHAPVAQSSIASPTWPLPPRTSAMDSYTPSGIRS